MARIAFHDHLMATVLVTDGDQRSALAAVRSLGRSGHRVLVCSTAGESIAGRSRYSHAEYRVADPLRQPAGSARDIAELARTHEVDVVLPITEATLLAVLPARAMIEAAIPFPDVEQFRRICDKEGVLAAAAAVGISVPGQHVAIKGASAAASDLNYPVVLKPARSVVGGPEGRVKTGVVHAANEAACAAALQAFPDEAFPVLIQERIVGTGVGVFLLVWDGHLVASFSHRRIREKPPAGGVSAYSESAPMDREAFGRSLALLRQYDWRGPAMVEYIRSADTGELYLMEINGRLWGSLELAVRAGVDFPSLLVNLALGDQVHPVTDYRVGVRNRWEWGDVDHMLARVRNSDEVLSLPRSAPTRRRAVFNFLVAVCTPGQAEVFRWSDPRPFMLESLNWIRNVFRDPQRKAT